MSDHFPTPREVGLPGPDQEGALLYIAQRLRAGPLEPARVLIKEELAQFHLGVAGLDSLGTIIEGYGWQVSIYGNFFDIST